MTPAPKQIVDPLDQFYQLPDLLCAAFYGSSYRFGELHFSEKMAEGEYPSYLVDPPDFMRGGWTRYHEISMVLHPEKGGLLLRMTEVPDDAPDEALTREIAEDHCALVGLMWKLHRRLEQVGFWKDRPIVLGVGLVTPHHCPDELRPANICETVLIDRKKLPRLPTHIDELFDYYTRPEALPVADWGERLITDLTTSPDLIGGFVDEDSLIEFYDEFAGGLDEVIEPEASIKPPPSF